MEQYISPRYINQLSDNEVFVFGSNLQGAHGGGAACIAFDRFGAQWGVGVGPTGQCYAIPTMHGGVDAIRPYVDDFIEYAYSHPEKLFLVTRIGCGIAGFDDSEMAPLFKDAIFAHNIALPLSFVRAMEVEEEYFVEVKAGEWKQEEFHGKERFASKDRVSGCIFGGAIGDALGYPVEFMKYADIIAKSGGRGIERLELDRDGHAVFSDDTQMSLFTATGLLLWSTRGKTHGVCGYPDDYVKIHYLDWLKTQRPDMGTDYRSWIGWDERLHCRRAPGITCESALIDMYHGRPVRNDSKGCGGVMRVAPVAVCNDLESCSEQQLATVAAKCAELTHKHILSSISSAALVMIINRIIRTDCPADFRSLAEIVWQVAKEAQRTKTDYSESAPSYYETSPRECERLYGILNLAINLADDESISEVDAIHRIGGGWVAEEALAIAVFCVLRHPDSFEEAVIAAVNHDGDSDSTGAICGNIMGALLGKERIPEHFLRDIEMSNLLSEVADDLYVGCRIAEYGDIEPISPKEERRWESKYIVGRKAAE